VRKIISILSIKEAGKSSFREGASAAILLFCGGLSGFFGASPASAQLLRGAVDATGSSILGTGLTISTSSPGSGILGTGLNVGTTNGGTGNGVLGTGVTVGTTNPGTGVLGTRLNVGTTNGGVLGTGFRSRSRRVSPMAATVPLEPGQVSPASSKTGIYLDFGHLRRVERAAVTERT